MACELGTVQLQARRGFEWWHRRLKHKERGEGALGSDSNMKHVASGIMNRQVHPKLSARCKSTPDEKSLANGNYDRDTKPSSEC